MKLHKIARRFPAHLVQMNQDKPLGQIEDPIIGVFQRLGNRIVAPEPPQLNVVVGTPNRVIEKPPILCIGM